MARNDKLLAAALGDSAKPEEAPAEDAAEAVSSLSMAAEELLSAVEAKDALGVESALRSAFEILSSEE